MDLTVWVSVITGAMSMVGTFGASRRQAAKKRESARLREQGQLFDRQLALLPPNRQVPRPPWLPPPLIDPSLPPDVQEWLRTQLVLAGQLDP